MFNINMGVLIHVYTHGGKMKLNFYPLQKSELLNWRKSPFLSLKFVEGPSLSPTLFP